MSLRAPPSREGPRNARRPPGRPAASARPAGLPPTASTFLAGSHELRIGLEGQRWTVAVDGVRLERWFSTQAEAWVAGVAEADRLGQAPGRAS